MRRHRDQELARQMVFGKKRRRVKKADGGYLGGYSSNQLICGGDPVTPSEKQWAEWEKRLGKQFEKQRANPVQKDSGGRLRNYDEPRYICGGSNPYNWDELNYRKAGGGQPRQRRSIESRPAGGYGFGKRTKKAAGGIGKIRKGVY